MLTSPKETEMLVPFGQPVAFPRMAGTSLRGQQLAASWSGFLCVQKHHCSMQSNASPGAWVAWRGDSFAVQPPVPCIVKLQLRGHRRGETYSPPADVTSRKGKGQEAQGREAHLGASRDT